MKSLRKLWRRLVYTVGPFFGREYFWYKGDKCFVYFSGLHPQWDGVWTIVGLSGDNIILRKTDHHDRYYGGYPVVTEWTLVVDRRHDRLRLIE